MASIKFDYFPYPFIPKSGSTPKLIFRPNVSIRLGLAKNHTIFPYEFNCVLDSGADNNLFHSSLGEAIGLNIKKGRERIVMGIGGAGIKVYNHQIKIYVGTYSFNTNADFCEHQSMSLLGRDGFFKFFKKVTFYENEQYLELNTETK